MTEPPFSPIFKQEFARLTHALANKAAVVHSLVNVIDQDQIPEAEQANFGELLVASQELVDVVVALQKLVGQR